MAPAPTALEEITLFIEALPQPFKILMLKGRQFAEDTTAIQTTQVSMIISWMVGFG